MNSKHQKTLASIFETPTRSDIHWSDIEKLVIALGGRVVERRGSRVVLVLNERASNFHRPHPQPTTGKEALRSVQEFLVNAGVKP